MELKWMNDMNEWHEMNDMNGWHEFVKWMKWDVMQWNEWMNEWMDKWNEMKRSEMKWNWIDLTWSACRARFNYEIDSLRTKEVF